MKSLYGLRIQNLLCTPGGVYSVYTGHSAEQMPVFFLIWGLIVVAACFNSSIPCSYAISATWPGVIITIWKRTACWVWWKATGGEEGRVWDGPTASRSSLEKEHCTRRYLMHRGGMSGTWSSQIATSSRPRLNDWWWWYYDFPGHPLFINHSNF